MLLPHYKRAEIALTDGNRRNNELAAERTGLFKQRDLMAALCSYDSCLAACYAAADDYNVLRLGHRAEIILGLHAGQRIDHAMYEKIFTKGKIGGVEIRNRVILSPMEETLGQASGEITPRAIEYSSIILSKSYSVINKNYPVYRCGFHPINQESLS